MRSFLSTRWATVLPLFVLMAVTATYSFAQGGPRPQMELLETKASATEQTLELVGKVKNVSGREVSGVTVYCDFQDATGKSLKVAQTHLLTDPLGPDKISEFKVSTPYNTNIKRFNVTFSQIFGGPLVTKDSRQ